MYGYNPNLDRQWRGLYGVLPTLKTGKGEHPPCACSSARKALTHRPRGYWTPEGGWRGGRWLRARDRDGGRFTVLTGAFAFRTTERYPTYAEVLDLNLESQQRGRE